MFILLISADEQRAISNILPIENPLFFFFFKYLNFSLLVHMKIWKSKHFPCFPLLKLPFSYSLSNNIPPSPPKKIELIVETDIRLVVKLITAQFSLSGLLVNG